MLTKFEPNHYLAFELSDKSRAHLLSLFKPKFSKVICHHVTLEFSLTAAKFDKIKSSISPSTSVKAYGYACGDAVECIAVAIGDDTDRPDGSFYHITISVEPPHKPVESNMLQNKVVLINSMFRSIDSVKLEGKFKLLKK